MNKLKTFLKLWILYALMAFPMFYFVYKYGMPDIGLNDFFNYYKLYANMDITHTDAPFNTRLISPFFVYLFNKAGFHYDTITNFDKIPLDKRLFFNAIFFNYLCIVSTCVVIYNTVKKHLDHVLLSFVSGLIYLLGFGTLFFGMMPITDAFSILMFSVILYLYLLKKKLIILPLIILILQREYIFLALGLICLFDYWRQKNKYYLSVLITCIVCFVVYFILRKTIFYTDRYSNQITFSGFIHSMKTLQIPLLPFIQQTLMALNIFILYLIIFLWKKKHKFETDNFACFKLLMLLLQIIIIGIFAKINTGRSFYIIVPLVIYELAKEAKQIVASIK
jgi:hypothetical protein